MISKVEHEIEGKIFSIEAGKVAKQADGAVIVRYADTMVLVTAVAEKEPREGADFFPLVVDYIEMTYAAGKIPGGFYKREGRPNEKEVLTSRFIDRPIRPLFPKGFICDTQIIATVLSVDLENEPDILAITGASAALTISDIPWNGPVAGVRVGRVDGKFVINPTYRQLDESDLNIIVVGTKDAVVMVEGGGLEVPEEVLSDAIMFGHEALQPLIQIQEELQKTCGKPKRGFTPKEIDKELLELVEGRYSQRLSDALRIKEKKRRKEEVEKIYEEALNELSQNEELSGREEEIFSCISELEKTIMRKRVLEEGIRIDGRNPDEIREISIEVSCLPRTHGSALFTRGETQALVTTTLGTSADELRIDTITQDMFKSFFLQYKFPPYCTGEVKMLRAPSRREIGHGALAERALSAVLPPEEEFPYTIRVVSEILESNGSSSMATVCGGSLSLMDAGVPVRAAVAGIAMGLIKEEDKVVILSDILGDEDHMGDMDFKVAGTRKGITAFQMDVKISGITREILDKALQQAKKGRMYILDLMDRVISGPRPEISPYAPRVISLKINPEKIKDLIGPGGKMIKSIIAETGVKIEVEDDGTVHVYSTDGESAQKAVDKIKLITQEAEVGQFYMGKVRKVMDFGALVEILPGTDGLIHISHLSNKRVRSARDVLKEGDEVYVKVIDIDPGGRIRLSRKDALPFDPRSPEEIPFPEDLPHSRFQQRQPKGYSGQKTGTRGHGHGHHEKIMKGKKQNPPRK